MSTGGMVERTSDKKKKRKLLLTEMRRTFDVCSVSEKESVTYRAQIFAVHKNVKKDFRIFVFVVPCPDQFNKYIFF